MPLDPTTNGHVAWACRPRRSIASAIALACCLMVSAGLESGCIATPRQPASTPPPPQLPEGAVGPEVGAQNESAASSANFKAKPTERQAFQVHLDFGRVFESHGDFDAAVMEYQNALSVVETKKRGLFRPADVALAHRRIGGALDRLGRFAAAEVHYQQALRAAPKDPKVWNDAGYSYYLQGRWADSEKALRTAAKLAPGDERVRINLGLALAAAGNTDAAFPLLSQSSSDATGHANLGYLLAATGQYDLARREYQTAVALRPDMELAQRALARLDRQERNRELSVEDSRLIAGRERSNDQTLDPLVQPAAATSRTIPQPRNWSFPAGARAPVALVKPGLSPKQPADIVDLSMMPPPSLDSPPSAQD
jgi:Flp pilus assembly protein TadD